MYFLICSSNDDVGLSVEATEAIWKMKKKMKEGKLEDMKLTRYKKPILLQKSKTNKLGGKLAYSTIGRRRSDDKDKLVIPESIEKNPKRKKSGFFFYFFLDFFPDFFSIFTT